MKYDLGCQGIKFGMQNGIGHIKAKKSWKTFVACYNIIIKASLFVAII